MPSFYLNDDKAGLKTLIGHCGNYPEEKTDKNGNAYVKISIANNYKNENDEKCTEWIAVNCYDSEAESARRLEKGQVACVVGKSNSWEYNGKQYTSIRAWFVGTWLRPPDTRKQEEPQHRTHKAQQGEAETEVPF